jgi:hypothetical protein
MDIHITKTHFRSSNPSLRLANAKSCCGEIVGTQEGRVVREIHGRGANSVSVSEMTTYVR